MCFFFAKTEVTKNGYQKGRLACLTPFTLAGKARETKIYKAAFSNMIGCVCVCVCFFLLRQRLLKMGRLAFLLPFTFPSKN